VTKNALTVLAISLEAPIITNIRIDNVVGGFLREGRVDHNHVIEITRRPRNIPRFQERLQDKDVIGRRIRTLEILAESSGINLVVI
jgi:hypothetical protein